MAITRTGKVVLVVGSMVLAVVLVVGLVVGLLFWSLRDNEPALASNSVLVLKLEGTLPDYAPEDPVASRFLGRDDRSLTSFLTQIRKAKADKRISAILLDIDLTMAGWAKADEIRDALADFRTSGKPVYAYMEYGTNKEYYIATACDRIYIPPIGDLFIVGLAADVMSLRGSLDKLGVYPDFERVGKYKSAPEQYTNKEMTPEHREVLKSMLDDIFTRYVGAIASARHKSVDDVKAIIDNAPVSAAEAQKFGLIDDAKYRDEVEQELKKRLGYKDDDKLRLVKAADYRRITPESLGLNEGERIAIIYASGAISSGTSSDGGTFGERVVGSDTVVKALNDARDDKSIKAIVLRVDSPGGTSYASDIIWHAVEAAKQKKPVVVSMSDLAASGGYYIAMGANRIVAQPSTLTGSIGVFAGKPVLKGFYDWIGVNNEYVLTSKNAGLFRETEKFTDEERAKFKAMLNSFYWDDFVPKVAQGRKRDAEYVNSIAQGRVWMGAQAKENGLVDEFGGMARAIEVAKQLANIPADRGVRRVVFPAPRTFLGQFFSNDDDNSASASVNDAQQRALVAALPADVRRTLRYAAVLDRMQRGEIMAMLPFDIEIK
ncbi:MAG TPA: signal peptide peptidase SppA [Pyrinomonadaceae bacterium]|nr:signal peptide peptidase SppA [Pyrinomonadaceae bacterium]